MIFKISTIRRNKKIKNKTNNINIKNITNLNVKRKRNLYQSK